MCSFVSKDLKNKRFEYKHHYIVHYYDYGAYSGGRDLMFYI